MKHSAEGAQELLLVEDNPGDADYIVALLEEHDPLGQDHIVRAENLAQARLALAANDIDAIILDLRLPDGNGVECVRAMREIDDDVPIVVLTSIDDEKLALTCINEGAQDYLSKNDVRAQNLSRAIGYAIARVGETTARRREENLRRLLVSLVGSSPDAIFSTDVTGRVTTWNSAAAVAFGLAPDVVLGSTIEEFIDASPESDALSKIREMLDHVAGLPRLSDVIRIRRGDDAIVVSVLVSPLRSATGDVMGRTVVCRDITELERRRTELRRRNQELETRDRQMRALTARLNQIREDEQTRIAREVHDKLGQMLTAIKLDLGWVERRLRLEPSASELAVRLLETSNLVDLTVETVQRIAMRLRPTTLDALGLPAAIRDEARRFERRTQLHVTVHVDERLRASAKVETELFRILQELLTNTARHAQAKNVEITLQAAEDELCLVVVDDGRGIDDDAIDSPSSLGLLGVRERAAALGGAVRFARQPTGGTVARVSVPHREEP